MLGPEHPISDSESGDSSSSESNQGHQGQVKAPAQTSQTTSNHPAGSSQGGSSQGGSSHSQGENLKLRYATMRILDFSTKNGRPPMHLKLEFTLNNGKKRRVDIPFTKDAQQSCWKDVVSKCEQLVWVENVKSDQQDKFFWAYLLQELQKFEEAKNTSSNPSKRVLELSKPSIQLIEDSYFWIAGPEEIFALNYKKYDPADVYAKKLSVEEIQDLPVDIVYEGVEISYQDDEEEAFSKLVKIIENMNMMQDKNFVSFPLASFLAHSAAFLYNILQPAHKGFPTTVTLSGSGNTHGTGKSLMTNCWQLVYHGKGNVQNQMLGLTKTALCAELESGRTVCLREWCDTNDILNQAIQQVWEKLGRRVRDKYQGVNAVVMVDANLTPEDIVLKYANESKVIYLATGSTPLRHNRRMQLCQEIEDMASELHNFVPVLITLGLRSMLDRITDQELPLYDGLMREDRDDRQGQWLLNYDRMSTAIEKAIEKYNLPRPLLFQCSPIDRTSLTFYNKREDAPRLEERAETVATYIIEEQLADVVEYSVKSNSFRLKLAPTEVPPDISAALAFCTKSTSTTFAGVHGVRVRLLSAELLTDRSVSKLRKLAVSHNFSDWAEKWLEGKKTTWALLVKEFKKQAYRVPRVVTEEEAAAQNMEIDDEIHLAGPSRQGDKRKHNEEQVDDEPNTTCTLPKCKSYGRDFNSARNFNKHIKTVIHQEALHAQGKNMNKKHHRPKRGKSKLIVT